MQNKRNPIYHLLLQFQINKWPPLPLLHHPTILLLIVCLGPAQNRQPPIAGHLVARVLYMAYPLLLFLLLQCLLSLEARKMQ